MTHRRFVIALALLALAIVPVRAVAAYRPLAAAVAVAGQTVSGTVSGSDSGFLTGAQVRLEGKTTHEATTDADGRFTLKDVPTGRYALKVMAMGHVPMENTMEVGDVSVSVDIVLLHIPGL